MESTIGIDLTPTQRASGIEALYTTGYWLLASDRFEDAADVFRAMCMVQESDERGWLGLGAAHEGADHETVAVQIYVTGFRITQSGRVAVALARALKKLGQDDDFERTLDEARELAERNDDEELMAIIANERRVS
jgi:hypothetical protein